MARDTTPASGQVSSGCKLSTGPLVTHLGPICLLVSSAEMELLDSSQPGPGVGTGFHTLGWRLICSEE